MEPVEIKITLDGEVIESFWATDKVSMKDYFSIAEQIPKVKKLLKKKRVTTKIYKDAVIFLSK
jgi:hypothetical protein